jgi:hypothetical protein
MDAMPAVDEGMPRPEIGEDVYSPSCAYNLHRSPGEQCPECGYSLERLRSDTSPIPWEHRRQHGRFRTFWQTVWLVTFRPPRTTLQSYDRPHSRLHGLSTAERTTRPIGSIPSKT